LLREGIFVFETASAFASMTSPKNCTADRERIIVVKQEELNFAKQAVSVRLTDLLRRQYHT
jgi:hypothetical protein